MSLDALRESLPAYARDLNVNLSTLADESLLTDQQKWGCFVASAYAIGVPAVVKAIDVAAAEAGLSETATEAAKRAAAIMGMHNVYFRALHLMHNPEYRALPARLRANRIAYPGIDRTDVELWELAVSAINGCGACLDEHEAELKTRGASAAVIQASLRIAAVVNAVSRVLAAEAADA
jgi:alkyl hydroperoxide reductase subunit D